MEERIDIYDQNRNRTGKVIARADAFLGEGEYMLYVLAMLQDTQGRYLIIRRALDKKWAAGQWEVPGGGVLAGETSAQAVVREVREEVGLDIAAATQSLEPLYSYSNVDLTRGDNYFVDIYRIHIDAELDDVVLQESEAIGCMFATWDEICELAEAGEFLHFARLQQALKN